jgi:hypothetical protein
MQPIPIDDPSAAFSTPGTPQASETTPILQGNWSTSAIVLAVSPLPLSPLSPSSSQSQSVKMLPVKERTAYASLKREVCGGTMCIQDSADHVGETRAAKLWIDSQRRAVDALLQCLLQHGFSPTPYERRYMSSPVFQNDRRRRRVNEILYVYGFELQG